MKPVCYSFFEVTLELVLPRESLDQWDLLYGKFRTETHPSGPHFRAAWESCGSTSGLLRTGSAVREMEQDQILLHLQDLVQNQVLPSVQSCLLWHGAAWEVGGRGLMILGDSGLGKTTLSLAEQHAGGVVLSDEIAAWNPERCRLLPFPRALAVRPDSLKWVGMSGDYARLMLDEEKVMVPLTGTVGAETPLGAVVFLEWPEDTSEAASDAVCEVCVLAPDFTWITHLQRLGVEVHPHPDGRGWWRCHSAEPLSAAALEQAMVAGRGVMSAFHRGACRAPSYTGAPVLTALDAMEAARRSLSGLINGRALVAAYTAPRVLAWARSAFQGLPCAQCAPGALAETREALRRLLQVSGGV